MIRAVLFDFDGVLVSTGDLHTEMTIEAILEQDWLGALDRNALREALNSSTIPTKEKLRKLDFSPGKIEEIYALKKKLTLEKVKGRFSYNKRLWNTIQYLRDKRVKLGIVSNTGSAFMTQILIDMHLLLLFDTIVGNDSNCKPKPDPAPYRLAQKVLNVNPWECLALEDSRDGAMSANAAGCTTLFITSPEQVEPSLFGNLQLGGIHERTDTGVR